MEQQPIMNDIKIEGAKGGIAALGAALSTVTLNEWVAIATLLYILIQVFILVQKHLWAIKDRKSNHKEG